MLGYVLNHAVRSCLPLTLGCFVSLACYCQTFTYRGLSPDITNPPTIHKDAQEVELLVTVTNHRGHLVRNLTQDQLAIYDNGESPAKITYFKADARLPLRCAVVIDTSDSVRTEIGSEKHAARMFIKRMLRSPSDQGMVIGFNQDVFVAQRLTSNVSLLTHAIKKLPVGGKTAVYDAVAVAARNLAGTADSQPTLKAIILISDGDDNSSQLTPQDVGALSQKMESTIYALDTSPGAWEWDQKSKEGMKWLSEVTGGRYLAANNTGVEDALLKVEKELHSLYAIGYRPPRTKPDGSFHRIVIVAPKKFIVRHRQGYFAK